MRWRLALLVVLAAGVLPTGSGGAHPAAARLTDCTCYDISRVDTTHRPLLLRGSNGNLWDVSSDRRVVLYSVHVWDLWVANMDGSNARNLLADDQRIVYSAALSPDRRWVSFRTDACDVCLVPASGGTVRDLDLANVVWVSWSPDSTRLAVGVQPQGTLGTVAVVNADGSGLRTLTGPVVDPAGPSLMARSIWSPSGDRIAYTAGTTRLRQVHVVSVSDGRDTVVAQGGTAVWSPDGTKLAFMWKNRTLAVIGADGRHLHIVDSSAQDGYGFGAAWSPGGRWLAYRTTDSRGDHGADNLLIAHPDGTHRRRVVRGGDNEEIGPIYWSRDGQTILYTHAVQFGD